MGPLVLYSVQGPPAGTEIPRRMNSAGGALQRSGNPAKPTRMPTVWWVIVLVAALTGAAEAFVLPGPFVLDQMNRQLAGAQRMRVRQTLEVETHGFSRNIQPLEENLQYAFPAKIRSDIQTPNGTRVHIRVGDTAQTRIDRTPIPGESRFDRYQDLLLLQSREMLQERLVANGVDVNVTSLGRFEEHIVFVVGARYPDRSVPQVWIDQQTFLPLRWWISSGAGVFLDVRYRNWRKFDRIWYPMQIEFFQDGLWLRTADVLEVDIHADFSDDVFDLAATAPSGESPDTGVFPEDAELREVQQNVEDFRKLFE